MKLQKNVVKIVSTSFLYNYGFICYIYSYVGLIPFKPYT